MNELASYPVRRAVPPVTQRRRRSVWLLLAALLLVVACLLIAPARRAYTTWYFERAQAAGAHPSAEAAMRAWVEANYRGITRLQIMGAGPNDPWGSNPHVWYVVAEVRAASYADGTPLVRNGCDAPGTYFFQSKQGWFRVPESLYTGLLGKWMRDYGLAGPGSYQPTTDTYHNRPTRLCQ